METGSTNSPNPRAIFIKHLGQKTEKCESSLKKIPDYLKTYVGLYRIGSAT